MLEAIDWSVVIVGRWNPSILTPAGIAQRLFKLEEGTPIEVQLAIDVMQPPVITHDDLRVTTTSLRLIIEPLTHSYECLDRARKLAINALDNLPETPTSAAGVNLKYICKESDQVPIPVQQLTTCELDNNISSLGHVISKRKISRSIPVLDGHLNLSIDEDNEEGEVIVQFNFELVSPESSKQRNWLTLPINKFEKEVRTTLTDLLEFDKELIPND